jgi:hypothetical protein
VPKAQAQAIAHRTRSACAKTKVQPKIMSLFAQQMVMNALCPPPKKVEAAAAHVPVKKAKRKAKAAEI